MKVPVTLIDNFLHSTVTEDGGHMVLVVEDCDANEISLGINCDQLSEVIDHCAQALGESERIRELDWDPPATAEVTWWSLKPRQEDAGILLSLTFGSGGTLSFAFSERMTRALLNSLEAHMGNACAARSEFTGFSK